MGERRYSSTQDWGEWSASRPGHFTHKKELPVGALQPFRMPWRKEGCLPCRESNPLSPVSFPPLPVSSPHFPAQTELDINTTLVGREASLNATWVLSPAHSRTLNMEAADFSETLLTMYEPSWCHISKNSNTQTESRSSTLKKEAAGSS
jgi:hypothetical protein